jgi:hypothetical protein
MLSPLDDHPIHQTSQPIRVVETSDRNFYDRYYFNLFEKDTELFVTAGIGQYPNLGVVDAFVAATTGGHQYVLRSSRDLGDDRMDTTVGPISVEIIEGLKRLRLRADANDGALELDVTWSPSIPAFLEARHVNRRGSRITTETSRFAQTGFWSGHLRIGDTRHEVTPDRWWGGRDRSWGIRPVGDPERIVRRQGDGPGGFLWIYSTMQFDDFTIVCILQEDRHGNRSLEQAVRIWPEASGRPVDDLGYVDHELHFVPGSRRIEHATLTFRPRAGSPLVVEVQPYAASYLSLGTGYGNEPDWRHGVYQGPLVVEHKEYDLSDPEIALRTYGLTDNLARYRLDTEVGHGLFENAVLGPNDRYGLERR